MAVKKGVKNIQSSNIFETTSKLLSMDETIDDKYNTYWLSNDLHMLMVGENYVNNILSINVPIKNVTNLAYSSSALSDADIVENSVNGINWELSPYVCTNILNAASKCNTKCMIKFPQYLNKIATINRNMKTKNSPKIDDKNQAKEKKNKKIAEKIKSDKNIVKIKKPKGCLKKTGIS